MLFKFILFPFLFSLFVATPFSLLFNSNELQTPETQESEFLKNLNLLKPFLYPTSTITPVPDPEDPLLSAIYILNQGYNFYSENKLKEAEELILNLEESYSFIAELKKSLLAKIYYERKNYNAALAVIRSLSPEKSEELYAIELHLLLLTNSRDKAEELFKKRYLNRSHEEIKKRLDRLQLAALYKTLDFNDWFRRFNYLLSLNNYSEFKAESQSCPFEKLKTLFNTEFLYIQKNYSAAASVLSAINNERLIDYKNRLLLKINLRTNRAANLIAEIKKFRLNQQIYENLLWDIIRIKYANLDFDDFEELSDMLLEIKRETDPVFWQLRWLKAWYYYKTNKKELCLKTFHKLLDCPDLSLRVPAIYWFYNLQEQEPELLKNYPFSYYSVISFQDYQFYQKKKTAFISFFRDSVSENYLNHYLNLKKIYLHGFTPEALGYAQDLLKREGNRLNQSESSLLKVIESLLLYQQKKYQSAFYRFSQNFAPLEEIIVPNFLAFLVFPKEHYDLIRQKAQEFGISDKLVLAIIRQESFFNHQAVSTAKAMGLMQLLPSTAKTMSTELSIADENTSLFEPERNIMLGIAYFKKLLLKYDQRLYLTLAAYNAGDAVVDRWLQLMPDLSEELFIENIPYSETRGYVKTIIRNKFFYEFYYGKD